LVTPVFVGIDLNGPITRVASILDPKPLDEAGAVGEDSWLDLVAIFL